MGQTDSDWTASFCSPPPTRGSFDLHRTLSVQVTSKVSKTDTNWSTVVQQNAFSDKARYLKLNSTKKCQYINETLVGARVVYSCIIIGAEKVLWPVSSKNGNVNHTCLWFIGTKASASRVRGQEGEDMRESSRHSSSSCFSTAPDARPGRSRGGLICTLTHLHWLVSLWRAPYHLAFLMSLCLNQVRHHTYPAVETDSKQTCHYSFSIT